MRQTKIVVTSVEDDNFCKCRFCDKKIAEIKNDIMVPSAEECYKNGNVPVPNFGWFCSQACAVNYETKFDINFAKTKEGKIDYYL
ncbi:hypothetical protein [Ferruginibacter sp. SUN106]|uniref:hypothetical protein n=1 Tax=Ferruginibacter sp. SUN106 TaxID=2978348 RepID=UPI003D35BCE7